MTETPGPRHPLSKLRFKQDSSEYKILGTGLQVKGKDEIRFYQKPRTLHHRVHIAQQDQAEKKKTNCPCA
jgi:hypothetical protein